MSEVHEGVVVPRKKMEWAFIATAIAGVLNWAVGFQWDGLSETQAAAIMAVINAAAAVFVALKTRPVPPAVFNGLVTAGAALLLAYGFSLSPEQVASFTLMVQGIVAFLTRQQVSPTPDAPFTGVLGYKLSRR